jgi:hypothetical protein
MSKNAVVSRTQCRWQLHLRSGHQHLSQIKSLTEHQQGEVYVKVIKDVVEQSRVDFEEGGVEASALEMLQLVSNNLISYQHESFSMVNSRTIHLFSLRHVASDALLRVFLCIQQPSVRMWLRRCFKSKGGG